MSDTATQILEEATPRRELVGDNLRAGADWFHENEGELFERDEALTLLQQELDVDEETASAVLAELAGDTVDPIVHIPSNGSKHYGVVEYEEFQGAYGYVDYDDVFGKRKRVVCAKCVEESTVDSDVAHATAGDHSGQFADQPEADYDELLDAVHSHYIESHGLLPEEVKTGASLVSGTTIGGNTSWHSGNDGSGSGLDADTLDGNQSSHFLASSNYNPESDTHSRYADSEAVSAVDSEVSAAATSVSGLDSAVSSNDSDISSLQSNKSDTGHTHDNLYYNEGQNLTGTSRVGGSGLFFDFDNNNSWIELVDGSGNRDQLVTGDLYGDGTWFSEHRASNNAHHSRYSDSEARGAVESGDVDHVQFSNIEDVSDGQIGRDNSIGFLAEWAGHGTAVLWDSYNVIGGNAISISGGKGDESNPTISVSEGSISHDNIAGVSSSDHHSRYSDSEASSAAPVQTVNGQTGDISISGFSGSHNDLTNVGSSDHHSRYSDGEARTAVANGDSIPHAVYASKSDVPALSEGESVYISGDGLYIEDGT